MEVSNLVYFNVLYIGGLVVSLDQTIFLMDNNLLINYTIGDVIRD